MASAIFKRKAPTPTGKTQFTATYSPSGTGLYRKPQLSSGSMITPKKGRRGVVPRGADSHRS